MPAPISLPDFFESLRIEAGYRFYLPGLRQHSRTRGGEVLTSVLGRPLWQGTVTAIAKSRPETAALQAMIEDIDQTGKPFLVRSMPGCAPAADPNGALILTATPTILEVMPDNTRLQITGLPVGYRLQRGDFLSFMYGSDPVRFALHRITNALSVAGPEGGATVSLAPHIRPGATVGTAVRFHRPICKAVIVPDSISWPDYTGMGRVSFDFIQTLR